MNTILSNRGFTISVNTMAVNILSVLVNRPVATLYNKMK